MTDIVWGAPIPVDGARPDWLHDDEICRPTWGDSVEYQTYGAPVNCVSSWPNVTQIRLPADHPYYAVAKHNAENGTNFTYWPGGDEAPGDYDGSVMFRDGASDGYPDEDMWRWDHSGRGDDIIGYTRKSEPIEDDSDYVRVKRMTVDEWLRLWDQSGREELGRHLGIIKEETQLEKYEREHGLSDSERGVIEAFIEWSANND